MNVFTGDFLDRDTKSEPVSPAPIFIPGVPRSGSTLIEQILASHSLVEGAGKLPYIIMISAALGKNQSYNLQELGEYYLQYRRIMDHWDNALPGRILKVQYESPRVLRRVFVLTQCSRYRKNGQGLAKNSSSGGGDHEGICVGDNLCFHHS
jgi:sulfotransferase family protein